MGIFITTNLSFSIPISLILIATGIIIHWVFCHLTLKRARKLAANILTRANQETKFIADEIQDKVDNQLKVAEDHLQKDIKTAHSFSREIESKIFKQETELEKWSGEIEEFERLLENKSHKIQSLQNELDNLSNKLKDQKDKIQTTLIKLAGYSLEEAKTAIFSNLQSELELEAKIYCKRNTQIATEDADRKARSIVSSVINRCNFGHWSGPHLTPYDISRSDTYKGYIIEALFGKGPENAKVFTEKLGVELIFDPKTQLITVNTGDGVLREIARRVLEKLSNIHSVTPEIVGEVIGVKQTELEQEILEAGHEASNLLKLKDVPLDLLKLVGRLKYRSSFGQNVLWHSVEVAHIAGLLAAEIGLNPSLAKRTGFFHDIGKAVDHEKEGGHPELGKEILLKYNEPIEVLQGVAGHHEDIRPDQPYATLINASDAISASRPGARRETFEKYICRLEKLEAIAYAFPDIENAFAISAGRELRVIVNPAKVNDEEMSKLAQKIARTIEEELNYPGKVKVTLVRETKVVEYAR